MPAPSGRQTVLTRGEQCVVVVEVGGGLRAYTAGGIPVLDGYGEDERCSSGRGQPLLPWPNRLAGGTYEFDGVHEHAPLTEADRGNAIHGLTRWLAWDLVDAGTSHATLACTLHPQSGWAWTLDLSVTYRLEADGLHVTTAAVNRSPTPSPFGAGWHPYLRAPSGRVDDLVLTLPAAAYDLTDEHAIPTGRAPVAGTPLDFRAGRPIGATVIDTAFTELARTDGEVVVGITDADTDLGVSLRMGPGWEWAMVFTGDTLGERARKGLAVEPMTCPANMLRSGEGRIVLAPGARWKGIWSVHPGWI